VRNLGKFTEKEILDDLASYYPEGGWKAILSQYNKYIFEKYPFCIESCVEYIKSGYFEHYRDEQADALLKYTGKDFSEEDDEKLTEIYQNYVAKKIFDMATLDRYMDSAQVQCDITPELVDYYVNFRSESVKPMDFKEELKNLVGKYDVSMDQLKSAIRSPEVKKSLSADVVR